MSSEKPGFVDSLLSDAKDNERGAGALWRRTSSPET